MSKAAAVAEALTPSLEMSSKLSAVVEIHSEVVKDKCTGKARRNTAQSCIQRLFSNKAEDDTMGLEYRATITPISSFVLSRLKDGFI